MCINYLYAYKMRIKIDCDTGIIFRGVETLTLQMADKI
jgi:hypothetical protein